MKTVIRNMVIVLTTILSGCQKCNYVIDESQYIPVRIDPNSADTFVMAMMPIVNRMDECQIRRNGQDAWILRNFDKCLTKLESERGLEPIPRKDEFRSDPNFTPPAKPWFEPYDPENWHPSSTPSSVKMLIASMGISSINRCDQTRRLDDWIDNYEKRMKRLEKYFGEPNDANAIK